MNKLKLIMIVGDGRSGSTLLESILNNIEGSISIGESFRFWERYPKNETSCGCGARIQNCVLWSKIDAHLTIKFPIVDHNHVKARIKRILLYKNFDKINPVNSGVKFLLDYVREFYLAISKITGKAIILDSSKAPAWAKLLSLIPEIDLRILHLERRLPLVANSWKKKVLLPEFIDHNVLMPRKSNSNILRTWLKVKWLAGKLEGERYIFIRHEDLCRNTTDVIRSILLFINIDDISERWIYQANHAIAGNPMRRGDAVAIKVLSNNKDQELEELSLWESYLFELVHFFASKIIKA